MDELFKQGIKLFESGSYQYALDQLLESGVDPAENTLAAYYLGLCYTKLEQYDDALIYLEQVVTSSENLLHIYQCRMVLGFIYTVTSRYELAQFEFTELVSAGYESPQAYSALGYIAYVQKEMDKGLEYFEKALELDPENVNASNSLGFTLAELGLELDRAENLCKTAVKADPKNSAYMDSLGWVFYKKGNLEDARRFLRRALDLKGENKEVAAHLRAVLDAEKKQ